jgi:CBS domain-containing protein
MKQNVFFVKPDTTVMEAAAVLVERRVGTLPVVDDAGILIGVTSIKDIIQIFLPDFVSLLSDIDFVKDYGALASPSSERQEKAKDMLVTDIMEEPVGIEDDSSFIKALSVMEKHGVPDLPVLKRGILVGIASRVDIGRALFIDWQITQAENPKEL